MEYYKKKYGIFKKKIWKSLKKYGKFKKKIWKK